MITITLPWPNSRLLPNRKNGQHWTTTHKIKQEAIKNAFYVTKKAISGRKSYIGNTQKALKIIFYAPDRRRRDLDNLLAAMKPSIDGIAQAIMVDDSNFKPITLDIVYQSDKRAVVEVTVSDKDK